MFVEHNDNFDNNQDDVDTPEPEGSVDKTLSFIGYGSKQTFGQKIISGVIGLLVLFWIVLGGIHSDQVLMKNMLY